MLKLPFYFLIGFFVNSALATDMTNHSAHREPNQDYREFMSPLMRAMGVGGGTKPNAVRMARRLSSGDLPHAVTWNSVAEMQTRFEYLRDRRFLHQLDKPHFDRRSSWLYPDDGCFARAALANRNMSEISVPIPNKVFAYGDLRVHTANAPGGTVTWWYHVAPIVEVEGQKYVLDPAIEPHHPLKLEDWLAQMSDNPDQIEVSICESGTYVPGDDCSKKTNGVEEFAESDQQSYLEYEWDRLVDLGRQPERELGDNPPWLQ
ncbi:MAG: protein-glutamine glutaminase family protein [Bdellovibrionales bacterium]